MRYRVWLLRNAVTGVKTFEVPDWRAGRWFLEGMMSLEPRASWVEHEACGMEVREDKEWAEWQDGGDRTILEYIENPNLILPEDGE